MEVHVRYNSVWSDHIPITAKTTVTSLINILSKNHSVESGTIKLIYKGKQLLKSKNKLVDEGIGNDAKLLMVVQEKKPKGKRPEKRRAKSTEEILMDKITVPDIVKEGPPEGAIDGLSSQVGKLPKEPFSVYTIDGRKAKLRFESNALFVEFEDHSFERLFDVNFNQKTCDIEGYEGSYISLYLTTGSGNRVFHFIPKQYQNVLKEYFSSNSTK